MLDEMRQPLEEKGIRLVYDEAATALIAKKSHGRKLGARDIRRVIRSEVEDKIAELIIDNGEGSIAGISISADGDSLKVDHL